MNDLIEKLGINWKLLLAQMVNFLIILFVLRLTIYQPLINLMRRRREKIEQSLKDAAKAEEQIKNIDKIKAIKMAETEKQSLEIIHQAEKTSKESGEKILSNAKQRSEDIIADAEKVAQYKQSEAEQKVYQDVSDLVKKSIEKMVGQETNNFDQALFDQALAEIKKDKNEY